MLLFDEYLFVIGVFGLLGMFDGLCVCLVNFGVVLLILLSGLYGLCVLLDVVFVCIGFILYIVVEVDGFVMLMDVVCGGFGVII